MLYIVKGGYRGESKGKGLSHYLAGQNAAEEVIQKTSVEKLALILSGPVPGNPAELLSGGLLDTLIKEASEKYHYVIVDSPPIGSVTDSAVTARVCDGVLFVIQSGQISSKFARKMKEQMERTGCPLVGVVLNKVTLGENTYYG